MPTINDITTGANYQGNKFLGGYSDTAIELDTKPIQQLAQYTFLYNKSQYDQRQKDTDEKITELAALAPYDLMNGLGKDVEQVKKDKLEFEQYSREYLSKVPTTPQEKLDQEIEFKTKKRDLLNRINSANQRQLKVIAETNRINNDNTLSVGEKSLQLEDLKKQFDNTDILTPITSVAKVVVPEFKLGEPVMKTSERIVVTPDGDVKETNTFFSYKENLSNSYAEMLDLFPQNISENATDEEKRKYKIKESSGEKYKFLKEMATAYNSALLDPKYSKTITDPVTGVQSSINEVDLNKIKGNPLAQGQIDLIKRFDAYQAKKEQDFKDGKYNDFIDPKTKLLINVSADEFTQIDPTKPLQPEQIILLEKFRRASPDIISKEYKHTGDATKVKLENIQQAGENWRLLHKPTTEKAPPALVDEAKVFTETLLGKIAAATNPDGTVDLAKAQLTPLELQMMGNGSVDGGKFSLTDPLTPTAKLRFDKTTNTIVAEKPKYKVVDGKKVEDGSEQININFQQIANNKYNSNSITETGAGENKNRQQLISDYSAVAPAKSEASKNKTYNIGGKEITEDKLIQGAKKFKMTLEQYKASLGIQ